MVSSSGAASHLPATDLLSSPVLHRLPRDETIVFYTQACERTRCAGSKSGPRRSQSRLSLAETRPSAVSRGPARPAAPASPAAARAASGHAAAAPPSRPLKVRRLISSAGPFCRGINCLSNLSDLGCREYVLVFGEINAKRLVVREVAFKPLNVRPKLAEYPIRFRCCSAKLLALEGADLWNVAFDDELAQCHI